MVPQIRCTVLWQLSDSAWCILCHLALRLPLTSLQIAHPPSLLLLANSCPLQGGSSQATFCAGPKQLTSQAVLTRLFASYRLLQPFRPSRNNHPPFRDVVLCVLRLSTRSKLVSSLAVGGHCSNWGSVTDPFGISFGCLPFFHPRHRRIANSYSSSPPS